MAGIYIKGMDMPVQCVSCPLWWLVPPKNVDICRASQKRIKQPFGSRPEWCPLIEVPAHGRLIDADAMERLMCDTVQGDIRGYPYSDTLWDTTFRWLDHQPTIIPAEEDNGG